MQKKELHYSKHINKNFVGFNNLKNYSRVSTGNCVFTSRDLPIAEVHRERITQEARNATESHFVIVFNTSAVDVPKTESLAAPPKEAPRPELLLSCIKITKHKTTHNKMKRAIAKK